MFLNERSTIMSATDRLIQYITNLTPSQIDKLASHLPKLTSLLEEPIQPYPQEQTVQNQ